MDDKPKIKPCRDVVVELQFENETLRAELDRLRTPLPCGHHAACARAADDLGGPGTGFCGWCAALDEAERLRERLAELASVVRPLVAELGKPQGQRNHADIMHRTWHLRELLGDGDA